jgi:DNA-binding CsgD family transcriptional regulator
LQCFFECGFVYTNFQSGQFVCLSSNMTWRYQFLEKDLDYDLPELFQVGVNVLNEQHSVKQVYNNNFRKHCIKMCFFFRYEDGFDMFSTSSFKPLNLVQQNYVYRKFRELAYMLQQRLKKRHQLVQELRMADAVKKQHALQDPLQVQDDTQKALFDGVALTAKELLYLEYLMVNLTQKEIAFRHQCSETAVRKVIMNVKKKLGQDSMPCSIMFQKLKERGVLIG